MSRDFFRKGWKAYYKAFYRIAAFALCTFLMVLSFPSSGRFNYDYEIKRPWRYEDVIAPFDFPVLKPEAEVTAERDSLLKTVVPYFVIDTVHEMAIRMKVHAMVHGLGPKLAQYAPQGINADTLAAVMESSLAANVIEVSNDGIVDVGVKDGGRLSEAGELMLIKANVAAAYRFEDLVTPRSAYT